MTDKTPLGLNQQAKAEDPPAEAVEAGAEPAAADGAGGESNASQPPDVPETEDDSADAGESGAAEGAVEDLADLAHIREMVRQLAEHTKENVLPVLGRLDTNAETLAGSVEKNGSALREFIAGRSNSGERDGKAVEAAAQLGDLIRVHMGDFQGWYESERRLRRRWSSIAIAVAVPAFLLLGMLVEQQYRIIPLHDPTGGLRGFVWKNYGREVIDCAKEAARSGAGIKCSFTVHEP